MNTTPCEGETRRLQRHACWSLDVREPVRVCCLTGSLWVTLGDSRDFIVTAGRSVDAPARRRVVVVALEASRFRVAALPRTTAQPAWPLRWLQRWRRAAA